jgi:hypothetical protein
MNMYLINNIEYIVFKIRFLINFKLFDLTKILLTFIIYVKSYFSTFGGISRCVHSIFIQNDSRLIKKFFKLISYSKMLTNSQHFV